MNALFGDLGKALAEATELKRMVGIMNARLEDNTEAMRLQTEVLRDIRHLLDEIRAQRGKAD